MYLDLSKKYYVNSAILKFGEGRVGGSVSSDGLVITVKYMTTSFINYYSEACLL